MLMIPREKDNTSGYSCCTDWISELKADLFKGDDLTGLSSDAIDDLVIHLQSKGYLKIEPKHWAERGEK